MVSAISFGDTNSGFQAGIINSPVNTEFYYHIPLERLETPPNPSVVIPFSHDTDFVERGIILDQIYQKCAVLGSRTALVGLGGVGKSQLAIEYAYRTQDRSPETWVFWVHASNAARFEQSFRDIANCVKISGRQNPQANIFQLVHDWLRDDRKGEWVLILDNVDDAGFLVKVQSTSQDGQTNGIGNRNLRPLVAYLPQCPNGSILITTRSESVALELVEQRDIIAVEPMGKADALALFKNKLGRHEDSDNTAELAATLEFMPLAIVQAAAYISQREPRCSVRQYLQDFQKSDREKISLLDNEAGHLRRDKEAKNSIIITWHISFTHVRHIRPSAAGLLALMSLCDRQGIPESLVRSQVEVKTSEKRDSTSNELIDGFEDDVLMLRNYSFISISENQSTFEMHALVQLAMRTWMETNGKLEWWKQRYVKTLCTEFPTGDYENWPKCQELFPHAQSVYVWRMGKGVEAEKMSVLAMKARKRILGREHNDTLDSMAMVGLAYKLRGRWDAAEELFVQVIEMSKKKLGADHPNTLTSMANLAATYRNQGRWDAAEELEVQVMEMSKKKLGPDHPDTLSSMANLAFTWKGIGRENEAVRLMEECVQAQKRVLGLNHPHTISSCIALDTWKAEQEDVVLLAQSIEDG
ncbi:hypothetical protein NA56DRAFT_667207 [Hyaloscypha hepaticicola]|uniref:DUF7779 domain-containing protein n=1 Tax=Hyaloscypha hepaticicola TaxID=2082293 RepID=A0A2J6QMW6_9HELO|nr:hypothetical protein NA56DRAFT_667207 [Hyaloscypha hepaticicola]